MTAPVDAHEVAPGVWRVDTPLGDRIASVYALVGDDGALVYDTGIDGTLPAWVVPALARAGVATDSVRTVVISHCDVDHFGGIADAREQFPHARIVAGESDIPLIEDFDRYLAGRAEEFVADFGWHEDPEVLQWCRAVVREASVDDAAVDGELVPLGDDRTAIIRAVPGHSLGHLAVVAPWANAVLVGDAVLGSSVNLADGTPAFPPTYRHVDPYLATIATLRRTGADHLLTAHYPAMSGAAVERFLAESEAFVDRLDGLVRAELARSPEGLTLGELLVRLGPVAGNWPAEGTQGALAFPVVGHLERLARLGRLERAGDRGGVPVWRATASDGRFR